MNVLAKVDVVYERQWSSLNNLVEGLSRMERMGRLYGGFPKVRYTRAGIPGDIIRTFPFATVFNLIAHKLRLPRGLQRNEPRSVGQWVARHRDLAPIVMANGTAHRFLFPRLKGTGKMLVLERGSMHPEDFFRLPQLARKEAGFPFTLELPSEILDELEQTKLADFLIAGSDMVRDSYLQRGFPADRVFSCQYGVDHHRFAFVRREIAVRRPVRIGILGVIGFRKGLLRILRLGEWALRAGLDVELRFIGPVQDIEAHQMLARSSAKRTLLGTLKGEKLTQALSDCDFYLLPSYEEGLPFSVLEAMSTGLGAIVSTDTGAREAPEDGVSGIHLTTFTDDEFDAKLAPVLRNPERIVAMGQAARARIEAAFTVEHYCQRLAAAFEKLDAVAASKI